MLHTDQDLEVRHDCKISGSTLPHHQSATTNKLTNKQWQALIALHQTLLYEHHDIFLASQHPSSSPALKRLATKYAMPARMWRHGIHSSLTGQRRSDDRWGIVAGMSSFYLACATPTLWERVCLVAGMREHPGFYSTRVGTGGRLNTKQDSTQLI